MRSPQTEQRAPSGARAMGGRSPPGRGDVFGLTLGSEAAAAVLAAKPWLRLAPGAAPSFP